MAAYITTRDAFDHKGSFVRKGSPITFPQGAKIPKWVVDADKFKPTMVKEEPKPGDTKPKAAQDAAAKKTAQLRDLA